MCGINGIVSSYEISDLSKRITSMNDAIEHRGKDSFGTLVDGNVALGHRRLSIIDLNPTGNQPMTANSGNWSIVFNGEIYNHYEIRNQIPNYPFKGYSDTEVILAAIESFGTDWFLERANGMFAIGAYNHVSGEVFLLRDRLGIKPLYYHQNNGVLVFSSEIKGILSSGLVDASFNDLAIDDYLAYRYVREPNTFFKEIYQVESGHYLKFCDGNLLKDHTYWDVPTKWNTQKDFDENQIKKEFEVHLLDAVRKRMMAEVPLGCYLSGGVDSSLLTAIVQQNSESPVNTYNIGFKRLNEFEYARIIADQYDTIHHEILVEEDVYFDKWDELIWYKDAPLAVPNEIPLSIMSTRLKKEISVVLSGEGADELLGGYGRIFRSYFDFVNHTPANSFYDYFSSQYEYVSREMRNKYLTNPKGYREEFDSKIENLFNNSAGEQAIFRFFHKYHVKGLLQRVDTSTMQTTVEARVPFLDHELIEFVYEQIPYDLKLKWKSVVAQEKAKKLYSEEYSEYLDTPKYLLKEVAYDYLDSRIIDRKKVGFPVPLDSWMFKLVEIAYKELNDATWLTPGSIASLIESSKDENRSGQVLWMFINVERFRKRYFIRKWKW
jgi:asparagine synthase (glutamine-hydrolysing)